MTANEREYQNNITARNFLYKVSREEFLDFLNEKEEDVRDFKNDLKNIEKSDDLFFVALDWSIPVVMVKYFKERMI